MSPLRTLLFACLLATLSACQHLDSQASDSLYEDLGQRSGIAAVVEDLLYLIVDDDRINEQFRGIDVAQFHRNLTDQLCMLSGGPCSYSGREMRELHASMQITDTQFNALVEDLVLAMEQNDISTSAQNRLLAKLVPLYPEVRNL